MQLNRPASVGVLKTLAEFLRSCNRKQRRHSLVVRLEVRELEQRLATDDATAGVRGIDARELYTPGLTLLTGAGIHIGQVEVTRPGKPDFDLPANSHPHVVPWAVFLRTSAEFPCQRMSIMGSPSRSPELTFSMSIALLMKPTARMKTRLECGAPSILSHQRNSSTRPSWAVAMTRLVPERVTRHRMLPVLWPCFSNTPTARSLPVRSSGTLKPVGTR